MHMYTCRDEAEVLHDGRELLSESADVDEPWAPDYLSAAWRTRSGPSLPAAPRTDPDVNYSLIRLLL